MTTASTNSFNSLLDNVSLEASQNFDDKTNNINEMNDESDQNVHAMFSSRTYVKVNKYLKKQTNLCVETKIESESIYLNYLKSLSL